MNISDIQRQALDLSTKHEWSDRSVDQRFRYLIGEVGELSQELLRYSRDEENKEDVDRAVGHEIYDVVWNLCDLANQLGIDLETAFCEKLAINKQREWKQ